MDCTPNRPRHNVSRQEGAASPFHDPDLRKRLDRFLIKRPLPGLRTLQARSRFIEEALKARDRLRGLGGLNCPPTRKPSDKGFDPLRKIDEIFKGETQMRQFGSPF